MRRAFFFILLAGAIVLVLGLGAETSASSTSGAPTRMCMDCHIVPKGAEIKIDGLPGNFQPGTTYEMTIRVESAVKSMGDLQGGFAISVSDGDLIVADPKNTQKSDGYLTHTAEGALLRTWKFRWKAPEGKKKITLNVSVIAANGDFTPSNDGFARREFILQPQ